MLAPIPLISVDPSIMSSYDRYGRTGGIRKWLAPLSTRSSGVLVPEAATALKLLSDTISELGGDFRVTDCHRSASVQTALRAKYDNWIAHGKPRGVAFNSKTMKSAFVAMPGKSNHNGGRAVDIDVSSLGFPGTPEDQQLDKLWEVVSPIGWQPIISSPAEGVSESWHFDFRGELAGTFSRLGYEQGALCGAILVGHSGQQSYGHVIQALVCRAGQDIGKIDGIIGPKTRAALEALLHVPSNVVQARLLKEDETLFPELLALKAA